MAFLADNSIFASGLNYLRDQATAMYVCSGSPATVANVVSYQLARTALTAGSGGDITLADGDAGGGGRRATIAAKSSITVDTTGGADHLALMDGVTLFYVTKVVTQALTASNTVDVPTWDIQILDPTQE